ncbi:MAG: ImmA/IrrE family metallo-endopeptidase [Lachnospiraceae bacterium]|nr:ImmA/IrrE family metallo-endopeptidase [Lachnospiraceae bacterium]
MQKLTIEKMKDLETKKQIFFEQYNISENDIINSISDVLRDKLDFEVKEMELPHDVDGAIIVDLNGEQTRNNKPIKRIVVNSMINKFRQRFTVAHELAHYILADNKEFLAFRDHSRNKKSSSSNSNFENEVDYMAASILMPIKAFFADIERLKNRSEVEKYLILRQKYRVELPAIIYREQEVAALNNG